jgi:pyruvate formate lyase activating enzyme
MNHQSRREFLAHLGVTGCAACLASTAEAAAGDDPLISADGSWPLVEARHYTKLDELKIKCELCPRECVIGDRERGYCGVRENQNGTYYTLVHSRPCTQQVDPIEKKPLFHFLPGTQAFSIATAGCNMECKFCQNWNISQFRPEQIRSDKMSPEDIAQRAKKAESVSVAYTYSEPVIFYEYMYDCAVAARKEGIKSVMISNGYILEKPMRELCAVLDGVKIDLKAFTEKFYAETCSGHLKPVLDTLVLLKELGMWFELVVLIIPTLNDSPQEIEQMAKWVYSELGPDVPIHFSAFHPMYKIQNLPRTPVKTLERCRKIALDAGLRFAYLGNVRGHPGEHTYCPDCGEILIRRQGYIIIKNTIENGKCPKCETTIPGVWNA